MRVIVLAESSRELDVPADVVWDLWADVPARPGWHPRLEWARLDGPLAPGTSGQLKPRGTRPVDLRVDTVEPGRRLVLAGVHALPIATGRYVHEVQPLGDDRCRVTHRMSVDGPAARVVARLAGRLLRAWAQPEPLDRFAALALSARTTA